jgi:hypothetical protein
LISPPNNGKSQYFRDVVLIKIKEMVVSLNLAKDKNYGNAQF